MLRIAALNDFASESSDEEDVGPSREVLEAEATNTYNDAIKHLARGKDEDAFDSFNKLLINPYIQNVGIFNFIIQYSFDLFCFLST